MAEEFVPQPGSSSRQSRAVSGLGPLKLTQWTQSLSTLVERNVNRALVGSSEVDEMTKFVEASKERHEALKQKIVDAEKVQRGLLGRNDLHLKQIRLMNEKDAAECKKLDGYLHELQNEKERLKELGEGSKEITKVFGKFASKHLKLAWKSNPDEVRCPGGHLITEPSSPNDSNNNTTCDYWNCDSVNLP